MAEFSKKKIRIDSGIRGEPVEIRGNDLPNVNQQRYRRASLNGGISTCTSTAAQCTVLIGVFIFEGQI
jgi:hypothetical protein